MVTGDPGKPAAPPDESTSGSQLLAAVEITLVPGLGSLAQSRLYAAKHDLSEVFEMDREALAALEIPRDAAEPLLSRRYRPTAEEIIDWGAKEGCRILRRGGPGYPELLGHTFDPPLILYARGNLRVFELPCIAVVGTRRPTYYGIQMAEGLAGDLAQRGVSIVSGMARGIDAAAHRGCLEVRGRTIAVFGCGVDIIYPREHRQLTREILKEGLILSEFVPGTSPSPQNFPVRNRIISGLALGTLIVEASEYSGSLITARLAMEQNRELFALPGNITSPQSFGPNYLIQQGAKLVQSWRDIVEEFPAEIRAGILAKEDTSRPRQSELNLLSDEERTILERIPSDRATHFDKIYSFGGTEISHLANLLLNLEMRGWIRQVPGNLYIRIARPRE